MPLEDAQKLTKWSYLVFKTHFYLLLCVFGRMLAQEINYQKFFCFIPKLCGIRGNLKTRLFLAPFLAAMQQYAGYFAKSRTWCHPFLMIKEPVHPQSKSVLFKQTVHAPSNGSKGFLLTR